MEDQPARRQLLVERRLGDQGDPRGAEKHRRREEERDRCRGAGTGPPSSSPARVFREAHPEGQRELTDNAVQLDLDGNRDLPLLPRYETGDVEGRGRPPSCRVKSTPAAGMTGACTAPSPFPLEGLARREAPACERRGAPAASSPGSRIVVFRLVDLHLLLEHRPAGRSHRRRRVELFLEIDRPLVLDGAFRFVVLDLGQLEDLLLPLDGFVEAGRKGGRGRNRGPRGSR